MQLTGLKKTQVYERIGVLENTTPAKEPPPSSGEPLQLSGAYYYNAQEDKYVFGSKKNVSGIITISGDTLRTIRREYVNGASSACIAAEREMSTGVVNEILAKCNIKHESSPLTDEELITKSDEDIIKEELQARKTNIAQRVNEAEAKQLQVDAAKWRVFEENTLEPFERALESFNPPIKPPTVIFVEYEQTYNTTQHMCTGGSTVFSQTAVGTGASWHSATTYGYSSGEEPDHRSSVGGEAVASEASARVFVVGAFDWHFGARAEARYQARGDDWNIDKANEAIARYCAGIRGRVSDSKSGFKKCVLLLGGDLYNSLTGFTSNGTPLNNEIGRDTQFEAIMYSLIGFIDNLLSIFPTVELHFVRGNHGGTTDVPLAYAVKHYYRTETRLTFDISSCHTKWIRVEDVLFLLNHGASDENKRGKVPIVGKPRDAFVQNLLLAKPDELVDIKQKIFLMGDRHHFQHIECNEYEFMMFGSIVAGDQHADSQGMRNRARQNCLVVGPTGVEETHHIYTNK